MNEKGSISVLWVSLFPLFLFFFSLLIWIGGAWVVQIRAQTIAELASLEASRFLEEQFVQMSGQDPAVVSSFLERNKAMLAEKVAESVKRRGGKPVVIRFPVSGRILVRIEYQNALGMNLKGEGYGPKLEIFQFVKEPVEIPFEPGFP